jgi:hypothetical protein
MNTRLIIPLLAAAAFAASGTAAAAGDSVAPASGKLPLAISHPAGTAACGKPTVTTVWMTRLQAHGMLPVTFDAPTFTGTIRETGKPLHGVPSFTRSFHVQAGHDTTVHIKLAEATVLSLRSHHGNNVPAFETLHASCGSTVTIERALSIRA